MRISDWSSDVCSSDLVPLDPSGQRRDSLRFSPEARALEQVAAEDDETGDAASAEGCSPLGPSGGFLLQPLETIRHDLAKPLQPFCFLPIPIQTFSHAFLDPFLPSLPSSVLFTSSLP